MNENLFGTAKWAECADLMAAHLSVRTLPSPDDLLFGKVVNWQADRGPHPFERCWQLGSPLGDDASSAYLQSHVEGHILTVAPTRSGKGVGLIVPNLLNWNGSVVAFDPKGENYALTSTYRRDELGQRIWCFDPYHEAVRRSGRFATLARIKRIYNCLGTINEAMAGDLMAEAARIAEAIVIRPKDEKDPFFNTAAQAMIKAAIILICYRYERFQCPPISKIRELLLDPDEMAELKSEIETKLQQSNGRETKKFDILLRSLCECEAYIDNRDVRATVAMQTEFLEDRGVADILDADNFGGASDIFDPQEILHQRDNSVYIVIPPRHLSRQVRTVRLLLSGMLDETMRQSPASTPRGGYSSTLFLLDEVGQFGALDPLRKAVTLGAAYGTILWMFWQDLAQLKNVYPEDWGSFLSNSCIQQYFGCNDMGTAEVVSKRCGLKFASNVMQNNGMSSRGFFSDVNHQLTQFGMPIELIRQYEVVRACPEIVFTFKQGTFPILLRRMSYYKDSVFRQRLTREADLS